MNIRSLISFVLTHISKHKFSFILSNIVILISSFILLQTMMDNYRLDYDYIMAEKTVSCDANDLFYIDIPITNPSEDAAKPVYQFVREALNYGVCWYQYTSINFNEGDTGKRSSDVLYISKGCPELMNLLDEDGHKLSLEPHGDACPLIVGSKVAKRFPKGTRLTEKHTGKIYEVTQVLPEGGAWLDSNFTGSVDKIRILDEYVITTNDIEDYSISNGALVISKNLIGLRKNVNQDKLLEISEKYNNSITIKNMQQIVDEKKQENSVMYDLARLLIICIGIAMIIFIMSVSTVIWLSEQRHIGILMSFGYDRRDILKIVLLENIMRALLPCIVLWLFFLATTKMQLDYIFYVKALTIITLLNIVIMAGVSLIVNRSMKKSVIELVKEMK